MAIAHKVFGDQQVAGVSYLSDSIINQKGSPILEASDSHRQRVVELRQVGTNAADLRPFCCVRGAMTVLEAGAGCLTACSTNATVTVDIKKNGTTILSSVIELDGGSGDRTVVPGTLSGTPTAVQGDVFETVVAVAAGTGTLGEGLFAYMKFDEQYST